MTSFSFQEYLSALLSIPSSDIVIEQLSGGLTNLTSRATFNNKQKGICFPGSSTPLRSAIVKYAPPYIASIGPSQALSTKRQVVEANALRMLSDPQGVFPGSPSTRSHHPHIRIPELLFHDETNSVLIMSDLGRIPTLSEFLDTAIPGSSTSPVWLGEFLADLHCQTLGLPDERFRPFDNPESAGTIEGLVGTLPRKLLRGYDVADADVLGGRVEEDMATQRGLEERCFGMVDLWPGSILVGDEFVGLVDWEYAGKSSPGSELGMLTAHLHIPLLAPTTPPAFSENIRKFTMQFLGVYLRRIPPTHLPRNFTHSMLVSHGRELINAVEFQKDDIDSAQAVALIHAGARCLRAAACADVKEMGEILTSDEAEFLHLF
ncbi:kinase-like domain-containing protein [Hysterangium stoloniferum]|nr:kinase-like domain-containing protein [Hysterangium stoloniferum]